MKSSSWRERKKEALEDFRKSDSHYAIFEKEVRKLLETKQMECEENILREIRTKGWAAWHERICGLFIPAPDPVSWKTNAVNYETILGRMEGVSGLTYVCSTVELFKECERYRPEKCIRGEVDGWKVYMRID